MNVLSLFDGMACGRLALEKAGIKVDNYFASEIDKYAMTIAKKNWPDIIHVGDVQKVKGSDLPKIDLLIGGSPCQGFSFAGKQLNFDDPRSKLFFDFVRLKDECKPKYFLLENVKMKKESQQIITEYMGVDPVEINSALVSAQNRRRLYWSNLPIEQPEDKGIMLADILESGVIDRDKSYCIDANYFKGSNLNQYFKKSRRQIVLEPYALTEKRTEEAKRIRKESMKNNGKDYSPRRAKELVPRTDGKMNCLTATYSMKEHIVVEKKIKFENKPIQVGIATDINGHDILRRVYSPKGKSPTLNSMGGGNREPKVAISAIRNKSKTVRSSGRLSYDRHEWDSVDELHWRKLTPVECERLQTVPDNYTEGVSNTQRYKMLGNGWTVDVIAHIFKKIIDTPHKTA